LTVWKQTFLTQAFRAIARGTDVREAWTCYQSSLELERAGALRVVVVLGEVGTAWWRAFVPFMELVRSRELDVRMTTMLTPNDMMWCDVIWLQRPASPRILSALSVLPAFRPAKIVADNDDWLRGVPEYNPFAGPLREAQVSEAFDQVLELADVVTFATPELEQLYQVDESFVLPNVVDVELWDAMSARAPVLRFTDGDVAIGWAGSPTHSADLAMVEPAIAHLLRKYSDLCFVRLGAWGMATAHELATLPRERVFELGFEPHAHELPKYLQTLDIGICPLVENDFNRAKSWCKWLEYAAAEIPAVCSCVGPYRSLDQAGAFVVENTVDAWTRALEHLVRSEKLRRKTADRARSFVETSGSIQSQAAKWSDVLTAAMG